MSTAVDPHGKTGGWWTGHLLHALISWFSKTKKIHFGDEPANSAVRMDGGPPVIGQVTVKS